MTITVRRVRQATEVLAVAEPHEPLSSRVCGALLTYGLGRFVQAWIVESEGSPAAVLVHGRVCFDLWQAHALLLDEAAAPTLARLVDASKAWTLAGAVPHLRALLPFLSRARAAQRVPIVALPPPFGPFMPLDARTRFATPQDLGALVGLYAEYEMGMVPTRRRIAQALRVPLNAGMIAVAEIHGEVVGAVMSPVRSRRYLVIDQLTVHPKARGNGLSWALVNRMTQRSGELGLGVMAALAVTNPMEPSRHDQATGLQRHDAAVLLLRTPQSFRGQQRLRNALIRAEGGPVRHRAPTYIRPEALEAPDTEPGAAPQG